VRGECGRTKVKLPAGRLEEVGWSAIAVIVSGRGDEDVIKVPAYGNEHGVGEEDGGGPGGGKRGPRGGGSELGKALGRSSWEGVEGREGEEEGKGQAVAVLEEAVAGDVEAVEAVVRVGVGVAAGVAVGAVEI